MMIETATAITKSIIAITRNTRNMVASTNAMRAGCKNHLGKTVRNIVVAILLAASVFSQDKSAVAPTACGPEDISFNVKRDNSQHTLAQPEPRKALVYFVQDIGEVSCIGVFPTMKKGLYRAAARANQRNTYFSLFAEPGEHQGSAKPTP